MNWKLPSLKVTNYKSCQFWRLPKLKVAKIESEFSISFWKLLSYQVAKLPSCQIAKLPNCQVAKLPSCQIAKLQVAKLWTCDHGAKSLSFLLKFYLTQYISLICLKISLPRGFAIGLKANVMDSSLAKNINHVHKLCDKKCQIVK